MSFSRYRKSPHHARSIAPLLAALALTLASPAFAQGSADAGQLGLSVGVRVEHGNHRSFRQHEASTGEVRRYDARVYGGVGFTLGYVRMFPDSATLSWGLSADYWRSLFFTSGARRLGEPVGTTAQRMNAVAALSFHPDGAPRGTSAGLLAGAGALRFDFELPSSTRDPGELELATGDYDYVSAGIAGRIPFSRFAFALRGSYLIGFHSGALGNREVQDQPHGFDALAALDYRLLPWLDLSALVGSTLLALRLAPLPERPDDAPASVHDLYLVLGVGARAHL